MAQVTGRDYLREAARERAVEFVERALDAVAIIKDLRCEDLGTQVEAIEQRLGAAKILLEEMNSG